MANQKLIQALSDAIDLRCEIHIIPPSKHLEEWEIRLTKRPYDLMGPEPMLSRAQRIIPPYMHAELPHQLEKIVGVFKQDIDKVYSKNPSQ